MSRANIEEQTGFIKEQLDKIYYEGFYDQMLEQAPERLSAEIDMLVHDMADPKGISLPLNP